MSVGTSATTRFTDSGLTSGRAYKYTVRADDAAGNTSASSTSVTVTTGAGVLKDTQAPTTPGGLHSMGATESSVDLMWSASTDNVGVTGRYVVRDIVTIGGATYRCIQAYQAYGDPNWILVPSLCSRVS